MLALLTPFSVDEIHFAHNFDFSFKSLNFLQEKGSIFNIENLTRDIRIFLKNLNESDSYWATLSFYPDINGYANEEGIKMSISPPILINKDSCPILLSKFIMNRLNIMIDLYYLDDSIFDSQESIIIIKYTEIELK